jgi:DNA polymerase-3 subunit delta'
MEEIISRWPVVGHAWAIELLASSLASGRLAHAYLFTGPHGIGKTTLARVLAQTLECADPQPPCGVCAACKKSIKGVHPDIRVVEGVPPGFKFDEKSPPPPPRANDRERRILKIDQIREVQHDLARAPFEGNRKVVILRRFEEANDEAANAFLKTLEEPPAYATLLLTAQDANLLLPTIVSRCQPLALRPLSLAEVERALIAKWAVEEKEAALLAHLSGGRLGWAVRAHADARILAARTQGLSALYAALDEGRAERLMRADDLAKEGDAVPQLLELWLSWWRDVLLIQNGARERATHIDQLSQLDAGARTYSLPQVHAVLRALRATIRYLHQNVNTRLALEVLLLGLPRAEVRG